jgi:hypothetical protein
MNTTEYLDATKKKLGIDSDYALAKALAIRASTISGYRAGRSRMDDDIAVRVADILKVERPKVLIDCMIERSKEPEIKAAWMSMMEKFSTSFNSLITCATPRRAYRSA